MSTRSNIVLKSKSETIYLYHHHDGYPSGVGVDLMNRFYDLMKSGRMFDIYNISNELTKDEDDEYELTNGLHGDIEYVYEIDVVENTIRCWEFDWKTNDKGEEIDLVPFYENQNNEVD